MVVHSGLIPPFLIKHLSLAPPINNAAVKAEIGGEYHFRVVTDSNSRTALSIYGSDIFNDIVARPELSAESTGFSGSSSGFTPEMESQDTGACGDDASSASCSASVFGSVGNGGGVVITEGRTGSVVLTAGELVPLQLRYTVSTRVFRTLSGWIFCCFYASSFLDVFYLVLHGWSWHFLLVLTNLSWLHIDSPCY